MLDHDGQSDQTQTCNIATTPQSTTTHLSTFISQLRKLESFDMQLGFVRVSIGHGEGSSRVSVTSSRETILLNTQNEAKANPNNIIIKKTPKLHVCRPTILFFCHKLELIRIEPVGAQPNSKVQPAWRDASITDLSPRTVSELSTASTNARDRLMTTQSRSDCKNFNCLVRKA